MSVTDKVQELNKKVVILSAPGATETLNATVLPSDVLEGKTCYAKGVKVVGTIKTYKGEVRK